ncbi:hypothetical protein RBH94_13225 [Aestuariibaculum sp. YM273]|uniref:hypothetical protein n=1 Tax=Aestuariibaculum sp. YM273 TaxID=3070659 RepID=UPI0027DE20DB|nr:hypothetical protein [Aestuariibaculum sp. YM273]WMI65016.1 hypothetical protein RBH94_13225 [Aestuariibaculum sp. YM273]
MNKFLFFILIITAFASCDGRERAYMTNEAILKEDNLFKAFSEELHFIPERPVVIETDTILSTGFEIKINYHSTEHNPIIISKKNKSDSITYSHYKNFEANIDFSKNSSLITAFVLNKTHFNRFESPAFWNNAIMQYVWINHEASDENRVQLHTAFKIPETEIYKDFILSIFADGTTEIKEYQMTPKTI